MNGLNALCCVGACRFSWPLLPKKGEFKRHVGYHVKGWEWYVEYILFSVKYGPLLKGRHVDLLIVGSFSMRVLPLLVYQGLACLLILTGHVCGQGKETWTPWTFVSIKFDRVSISPRNGERKEIKIRLSVLHRFPPEALCVCKFKQPFNWIMQLLLKITF